MSDIEQYYPARLFCTYSKFYLLPFRMDQFGWSDIRYRMLYIMRYHRLMIKDPQLAKKEALEEEGKSKRLERVKLRKWRQRPWYMRVRGYWKYFLLQGGEYKLISCTHSCLYLGHIIRGLVGAVGAAAAVSLIYTQRPYIIRKCDGHRGCYRRKGIRYTASS